ncbi:MAG: hypothetical protein ABR974_10145 [Bacteroidales bacterium]|jgi:hypothetical protein
MALMFLSGGVKGLPLKAADKNMLNAAMAAFCFLLQGNQWRIGSDPALRDQSRPSPLARWQFAKIGGLDHIWSVKWLKLYLSKDQNFNSGFQWSIYSGQKWLRPEAFPAYQHTL